MKAFLGYERRSLATSFTMRASSDLWSGVAACGAVLLLYLFAGITTKAVDTKQVNWSRYLNPVFMTAGSDGKGSLSKLQILFFSMIVFGLLAYIVWRTGVLSDLSPTVLTLLGIAAIGSAAAKATDVQRNRIDFENWAWFIRKGWLPKGGLAAINNAKWRDIVTAEGEFDVYRYQSCIFSLVVGGALLVAGVSELASFTIPETLLGILGLSQVVYLAGKLVSPPSWTDLNKSTKALRELERKLCDAAATNPDPSPPQGTDPLDPPFDRAAAIRRGVRDQYDAYMDAAQNVRIGFESLAGQPVKSSNVGPSCA